MQRKTQEHNLNLLIELAQSNPKLTMYAANYQAGGASGMNISNEVRQPLVTQPGVSPSKGATEAKAEMVHQQAELGNTRELYHNEMKQLGAQEALGPESIYQRDMLKRELKLDWIEEQRRLKEELEMQECVHTPQRTARKYQNVKSHMQDFQTSWHETRKNRATQKAKAIENIATREHKFNPDTNKTKARNDKILKNYRSPVDGWNERASNYLRARSGPATDTKSTRKPDPQRLANLSVPKRNRDAPPLKEESCTNSAKNSTKPSTKKKTVDMNRLHELAESGKNKIIERKVPGIDPQATGVPQLCRKSLDMASKHELTRKSARIPHAYSGAMSARSAPTNSKKRATERAAKQALASKTDQDTPQQREKPSSAVFRPPQRPTARKEARAQAQKDLSDWVKSSGSGLKDKSSTVANLKVSKDVGDNIFDKFLEREYKRVQFIQERHAVDRLMKEKGELEGCTFAPKICKMSRKLTHRRPTSTVYTDKKPNAAELERRSEEAARLREDKEIEAHCTFKPYLHSWKRVDADKSRTPSPKVRSTQRARKDDTNIRSTYSHNQHGPLHMASSLSADRRTPSPSRQPAHTTQISPVPAQAAQPSFVDPYAGRAAQAPPIVRFYFFSQLILKLRSNCQF